MVTLDFSPCPPRCFRQISVSSVSSCSLLNNYGSVPRKENDDSESTMNVVSGRTASLRNAIQKMIATELLHNLGQSLWLDNITRDLLNSGTLKRYIDELSVTGLTSNPTIFDHAIKNSTAYDVAIRGKIEQGKSGEALFFDLALEDITRAADLFRPIFDQTNGVDGWVSLEVSPLLAYDATSTLAA